jgi:predicted dinucleotide-binding enzyme
MRIAIIGAGNVGRALGEGWARAGHDILFGVPNPTEPKHEQALSAAPGSSATTVADAATGADVIALAVPWDAVPDAISACGDLAGRIIIDATNPLGFDSNGLHLALGFSDSGGETVARLAPGAHVFKTMNQVGYQVMANAGGRPVPPVMFVAGDEAPSKQIVMGLVSDLGFEATDCGGLASSRLLEPFALLWIDQAMRFGAPLDSAFAFLRGKGTE